MEKYMKSALFLACLALFFVLDSALRMVPAGVFVWADNHGAYIFLVAILLIVTWNMGCLTRKIAKRTGAGGQHSLFS